MCDIFKSDSYLQDDIEDGESPEGLSYQQRALENQLWEEENPELAHENQLWNEPNWSERCRSWTDDSSSIGESSAAVMAAEISESNHTVNFGAWIFGDKDTDDGTEAVQNHPKRRRANRFSEYKCTSGAGSEAQEGACHGGYMEWS